MYSAVRTHAVDCGRACVHGKCVCESVHEARPTYVPSVPLPPQMAIVVLLCRSEHPCTHTYTHTQTDSHTQAVTRVRTENMHEV